MKFNPVRGGQPVAPNQRELDANKPVSVFWERTSATIGQAVRIGGIVKKPVGNLVPTVWILHNGTKFQPVANVKMHGGQIIAEWRVTPFKTGLYTEGVYDVEVVYAGQTAQTSLPLRIVAPGAGYSGASSFG